MFCFPASGLPSPLDALPRLVAMMTNGDNFGPYCSMNCLKSAGYDEKGG